MFFLRCLARLFFAFRGHATHFLRRHRQVKNISDGIFARVICMGLNFAGDLERPVASPLKCSTKTQTAEVFV